MKANYNPKVDPLEGWTFPSGMTEKEKRAWVLTAPYRQREYESVVDVVEMSCLYGLSKLDKDAHGSLRLRRDWESMIRALVKTQAELRMQDGEYVIAETGQNVENYYMREELRKIGVEPWEWQKHMRIIKETGEVVFDE